MYLSKCLRYYDQFGNLNAKLLFFLLKDANIIFHERCDI